MIGFSYLWIFVMKGGATETPVNWRATVNGLSRFLCGDVIVKTIVHYRPLVFFKDSSDSMFVFISNEWFQFYLRESVFAKDKTLNLGRFQFRI